MLNQNSIDDLEQIRSTLKRKNIYIDAVQFLIAEDGRVYITDPIRVIDKPSTDQMYRNAEMIGTLIEAARKNIKRKQ